MAEKPKSVDGHRWALLRKFVIPCPYAGVNYLTRWRIMETPWFAVLLHKIEAPDEDRCPHDHPWSFLSIILNGGYTETLYPNPAISTFGTPSSIPKTWKVRSIHHMPLSAAHKIVKLYRNPTWTLILTGPRKREWGFWENGKWVLWRTWIERNPERV